MNITAIKSALSNQVTVEKLRSAIHNTSKLGFSTDHVTNRKGINFLAVRCRGGVLSIHDRNYKDVTQLIVKVCRDILKEKNRPISSGETFYYKGELYFTKYQVLSLDKDVKILCENCNDEIDQQVLSKSTILKLIKGV